MSLTKEQYRAISHFKGPCMVLAGPGAGKTLTMVKRIAYIIEKYGVLPNEILALTFTKDAKQEMEQRFFYLMEKKSLPVTFATLHSFCYEVIRHAYGLPIDVLIAEKERVQIFNQIMDELALDVLDRAECREKMSMLIGRQKNGGQGWEEREALSIPFSREDYFEIRERYEKKKRHMRKIDFDDMLILTQKLFMTRPDILKKWQSRFSQILVDEFQDVNSLQLSIVKSLSMTHHNLFVVGDDDQSIYGFRGAKPETMQHFRGFYPESKIIYLNQNFRSQEIIVRSAQALIHHNQNRMKKTMEAVKIKKRDVVISECANPIAESLFVVQELLAYQNRKKSHKIGIIYRSHADAYSIMASLREYNVPFTVKENFQDMYSHFLSIDIISYFKLALGKRERALFLQVMNHPNRFIGREALQLEPYDFDTILEFYCDKKKVQDVLITFQRDLLILREMAPYSAIRYIRKEMGYNEWLREYAKRKRIAYTKLETILDEIMGRAKPFISLLDWVQFVEAQDERVIEGGKLSKEDSDHVFLQTMHGAKGLEYDVVFIISANEGSTPYKRAVTDAEIEEERRMFYVAMTRAKEELYITYVQEKSGRAYLPSRFLSELLLSI